MQGIETGGRALHEHEYSRRLWKWLEKFQFTEHPFAVWEADRERSVLPSLFVDRPYAVRLVGDPARPQSGFLLAGRGRGQDRYARDGGARVRRRSHPPPRTAHPLHRLHGRARPGRRRPGPGRFARSRRRHRARGAARAGRRGAPGFFALLDEDQRGLLQESGCIFRRSPGPHETRPPDSGGSGSDAMGAVFARRAARHLRRVGDADGRVGKASL